MNKLLLQFFLLLSFIACITLSKPAEVLASNITSVSTENGSVNLQQNKDGSWRNKIWMSYRTYTGKHEGKSAINEALNQQERLRNQLIDKTAIFQLNTDWNHFDLVIGPFENIQEVMQYFNKVNSRSPKVVVLNNRGINPTDPYFALLKLMTEGKSSPSSRAEGQDKSIGDQTIEASSKLLSLDQLGLRELKDIQNKLKVSGFYDGEVDGAFGTATKSAIKKYQQHSEEDQTGQLTVGQYQNLLKTPVEPENKIGETVADEANKGNDNYQGLPKAQMPQEKEALITSLRAEISTLRAENSDYEVEVKNNEDSIYDLNERLSDYSQIPVLDLLKREIDSYNYYGIRPGGKSGSPINEYVTFVENCDAFNKLKSIADNTKILLNDETCVTVDDGTYERIPGKPLQVELNGNVIVYLQERFPTQIFNIKVISVDAEMEFRECGFNLVFTNRENGKSFVVVMYAEGNSGTFAAPNKSIIDALKGEDLPSEENNWSQLEVRIESINTPSVTCEVLNDITYQIQREPSDEAFKITEDGKLFFGKLLLASRKDDLEIFISANTGALIEISGTKIPDPKFPFSNDLELQASYFRGFLSALEQYMSKSSEFKKVKIHLADENRYSMMFESSLPNSFLEISSEQLNEHQNSHKMPSVSSKLSALNTPTSSGIIVAGSFGLDIDRSCTAQEFTKILSNRKDAPALIINFASGDKGDAGYERVSDFPLAYRCPNRSQVLLLHPTELGLQSPSKIRKGFLKLISEGLNQ